MAFTQMQEAGLPDGTIRAQVGHISAQVAKRYAHIRTEAKRKALEAISNRTVDIPAAEKAAS